MNDRKSIFIKFIRYAIAFIGVVAAFITIYVFFFHQRKIELCYEITANTNVLDINADISNLDILYKGESLKTKKENLRIINIKVINSGTENILKNYYDNNDPLGFIITNGKIIEAPEILNASNNYLKEKLKFNLGSSDRINFSDIIIESGDYITIKVLVLHKLDIDPQIIPVGKIAGVSTIKVINSIEIKSKNPFLKEVFMGNFLVQAVRVLAYFIIGLLVILLFAFSAEKINNMKKKFERKHLINEFKDSKDFQYSKMDDAIFERFVSDGQGTLYRIDEIIKDEEKVNEKYKKALKKEKRMDMLRDPTMPAFFYGPAEREIFEEIIKDGILIKDALGLTINQAMKNTLDKFVKFLKEKNELNKTQHKIERCQKTGI